MNGYLNSYQNLLEHFWHNTTCTNCCSAVSQLIFRQTYTSAVFYLATCSPQHELLCVALKIRAVKRVIALITLVRFLLQAQIRSREMFIATVLRQYYVVVLLCDALMWLLTEFDITPVNIVDGNTIIHVPQVICMRFFPVRS